MCNGVIPNGTVVSQQRQRRSKSKLENRTKGELGLGARLFLEFSCVIGVETCFHFFVVCCFILVACERCVSFAIERKEATSTRIVIIIIIIVILEATTAASYPKCVIHRGGGVDGSTDCWVRACKRD